MVGVLVNVLVMVGVYVWVNVAVGAGVKVKVGWGVLVGGRVGTWIPSGVLMARLARNSSTMPSRYAERWIIWAKPDAKGKWGRTMKVKL